MTCKENCLCYSVCTKFEAYVHNPKLNLPNPSECIYFKDRSKYIELPCELGGVQKLVDKATPKKVVLTISTIRCPSCNKQLTNRGCSHSDYKFCRWCGQAIDWSEV